MSDQQHVHLILGQPADYAGDCPSGFALDHASDQDRELRPCLQNRPGVLKPASVVEVALENHPPSFRVLAEQLAVAFSTFGVCDLQRSSQITTALNEAFTNACYHGNLELDSQLREGDGDRFYELADQRRQLPPYRDRRIHVTARFSSIEVAISIRDEGRGFDVAGLPDPFDPEYMDRPYGRGITLMRTFLDEVTYNAAGNEVTLIKRRTMTN